MANKLFWSRTTGILWCGEQVEIGNVNSVAPTPVEAAKVDVGIP
jgi:hypothetical protein